MKRLLLLLPALLFFAAPAQAAPSCTRDGAKLLAASGSVRVVSFKETRGKTETRHDRVLGCRTSNGRRFTMFESVDHGEDSIQHDAFTIYGNRYVGADTAVARSAMMSVTERSEKSILSRAAVPCASIVRASSMVRSPMAPAMAAV